jgi:hypothetical protein
MLGKIGSMFMVKSFFQFILELPPLALFGLIV